MLSIFGFLVMLGPLVIVHEFGHFFFAKLFKVKAEAFSVGFGPKLLSKQIGETEFRFSLFPLGGYVKLLGEDRDAKLTDEEKKRALHTQAAYKRFFIFFGGPLFNFLFAIVIFMVILLIGEKQPSNVIGRVVHHSAAEKAGLMSGDRVTAVNGKPVSLYEELIQQIQETKESSVKLDVSRSGRNFSVSVPTAPKEGFTQYGEVANQGEVSGIFPAPRGLIVGVSQPGSIAGRAGLKTGDQIVAVNGQSVSSWEELEKRFDALPVGSEFTLELQSKRTASLKKVKPLPSEAWLALESLGLYSAELFIDQVLDASPAFQAGIRKGDRIIAVGGKPLQSFFELREQVQESGKSTGGKAKVQWEREGKVMSAEIVPSVAYTRDPTLKKVAQFTIGVMPLVSWAEPDMVVERIWNPFKLLYKGTERMLVLTGKNFVSLRKMIGGDVSVGTLGGPILIGKIAGESLSRGWYTFLVTMAVLSIGLGVLNILPVPVLDGGHLLLLGLEVIRGKPLSLRQMEIVQQVGLSLILLLMVVVIRNDLARLPLFN